MSAVGGCSRTVVYVDLPYPCVGSSQHLCIVHCSVSECTLDDRLFLDYQNLSRTVLAGAFLPDVDVYLRTPLPPPYDLILLPPIDRGTLRPETVRDETGKVLGVMLRVPGLFVQANRILQNLIEDNQHYNYRWAVKDMVKESARLLSSVVKSSVLGVRSNPGIMAHALERNEIAADEVGISEQFATEVLKKVQSKIPLKFGSVWDLDGFPVYAVRFPVANRHAVQKLYLRILPGVGKFIACNPFNLCKLWLGDRDGDQLFVLLRTDGINDHTLEIVKRPRVKLNTEIKAAASCVSLQNLLDPQTIECEQKLRDKMVPTDLSTFELRKSYITDADVRTHVAVYTMIFGWHLPRVLAVSGKYEPQEAYQKGNDVLEWFMEAAMDSRKGGGPFSNPKFNAHKFMRLLTQGRRQNEDVDFDTLLEIGVPISAVETIREAWTIAEGNLTQFVSQSPIYKTLVVKRNTQETSMPQMLNNIKSLGIGPEKVYDSIIEDLCCTNPICG